MRANKLNMFKNFLDELGIILGKLTELNIDNTSAMEMIKSNVKSRVKHLDRKKYWIREFLANKNATVKHVETKNNLADIFTKYVPNTVMERLRAPIMGRENPPRDA